ncbi:MAG TPA: NUDIX hydrolase [Flavobacterium sp.]|jgi:8-oxo-dGTP diphosphatase
MHQSKTFVTVDAVVFRVKSDAVELLLIQRKNDPFKGHWALPGGFVDEHEDLEVAAIRELKEETGLLINSLEQLRTFGTPHRDPRSHTVSVVHWGFAPDDAVIAAADDAADARWLPIMELPELAFDHDEIINYAIKTIKP